MHNFLKYAMMFFIILFMSHESEAIASPEKQNRVITFSGGEGASIYIDRIAYYAFKELGYELSILIQDINSASQAADSGYTEGLLSSIAGIEKKYPNLVMINEPISQLNYATITQEKNKISYKSWKDFADKKVGVTTLGPHTEQNLPATATRERYQAISEAYEALLSGSIEVIITIKTDEAALTPPVGLQENPVFDTTPTFLYVNKNKIDFTHELEAMLRKMNSEGITEKILKNELNHNDSKNKIILSISSYSSDVLWERQLQDAFRAEIDKNIPTELHNYSINGLKLRNDIYYRKNLSSIIRRDFINKVPSIIIVSDDEAFEFVKENYYSTFAGAPVIFCAVNNYTPDRIKGFEHIFTGVEDKSAATETVNQMLQLYPATKKIYVVTDYTMSGQQWRKDLERQLEPYKNKLTLEYNENLPFAELVSKIGSLDEGTLVLFGFYLVDGEGKYQLLTESQKDFFEASKVPLFGLYYPTYGQGQLGGKFSMADVQARHVRTMLKKLLTGTAPIDIPVVTNTNEEYPWFFEYKTLQKFGISKKQLPKGALITNEPLSFFEANRTGLLYASFVLAFTIITFLTLFWRTQKRKNKLLIETQRNLHTAEEMLQKEAELLRFKEEQNALMMRLQSDLQNVLDSLPVGILAREQGTLLPLYVNKAYIEMLSLQSVNEALKYKILDLSPEYQPNDRLSSELSIENLNEIIGSNTTHICEWQFKLPNNEFINTKKISRTIFFNGVNSILTILQDISADLKQRELLRLTAENEKEANRIKSKFVVNISHEIRTPMNAIIGFSEMALLKDFEKDAKDAFKKINTSAKILLNIINDVLDFSKIEAEKLELFLEDIHLEDTLYNAALVASKRIEGKPVEMLLQIDNDVPAYIHGDKTRIWQIFKNLLDNSSLYTNEGSIVLKVSAAAGNSDDDVVLTFTVSDTGLGMTAKQLERLFNSFERFHNNQGNALSGTGLGMSITKQLVELMQGSIHVESEVNMGTTTTIVIPFKKTHKVALLRDKAMDTLLQNVKIIVADDSQLSLEILENILTMAGCTPACVVSGTEALNLVEHATKNNEIYDVVLLDYKMKDLDGFEVARQIKEMSPTTKIILVSGYIQQFSADEILDIGFAAYVEKPFSSTELLQKILDVLNIEQDTIIEQSKPNFPHASVLVVEDNLINQSIAECMLEELGITPIFANNGQEALKLLDEQNFDLILMDLLMPVMDGHTATQYIRASDKPYKDIPIIAMTANVVVEEIKACMDEGMNAHIGKPVDFNNLTSQLSKWLPAQDETVI